MFPLEKAKAHAEKCYPMEACGIFVSTKNENIDFMPCEPSKAANHFAIPPQKWLEAERAGELKGIFHSHPGGSPIPSANDLVSIEAWGLPWVIMSWPSGEHATYEPQGSPKTLLGRTFEYGACDCYDLIRDYYGRLGVPLPDFERHAKWEREGLNLYLDNFEKAGFAIVDDGPREHDVLLLQINSPVPNHGAIYLGDNRILHHLEGRLSARAVYGDFYRKATTHVLRHKELMGA